MIASRVRRPMFETRRSEGKILEAPTGNAMPSKIATVTEVSESCRNSIVSTPLNVAARTIKASHAAFNAKYVYNTALEECASRTPDWGEV
jgi:hypothetical protein